MKLFPETVSSFHIWVLIEDFHKRVQMVCFVATFKIWSPVTLFLNGYKGWQPAHSHKPWSCWPCMDIYFMPVESLPLDSDLGHRDCVQCSKHSLRVPTQKLSASVFHMLVFLSNTGLFRVSCATLFSFLEACVRDCKVKGKSLRLIDS